LALRFSIITPTLNRSDMLVEALDSVACQEWPEIEHIVVDGGSTDGTLELMASHPDIRLIGGPDEGVYDALNKGIAAAGGDVVCLLNSDDTFEPGALKAAAAGFAEDPACDSVCGSARLVAGGKTIEVYDRDEDKRLTSARTALLGASIINARFFRKASLHRLGPFSLAYRVVSDRDLLMRAITMGLRTKPVAPLVYTYRRHHASLSFSGEAAQRLPICQELLAVARYWADAETARPSDRRIARTLEGRCLGRLIQRDLAAGRPKDAWRLLAQSGRGLPQNLTALAEAVIDAAAVKIAS
jgi:glycosyltransferase involved in cell wall biosynthesis